MKRLRWIIPLYLGLIVFCIVALSFLMTPLKEAPYQGDKSELDDVVITLNQLSYDRQDEIVITMTNHSTEGYGTGRTFNLEVKQDGKWYTIETGFYFTLEWVGLEGGASFTQSFSPGDLAYDLERETEYRITKTVDRLVDRQTATYTIVSPAFRIE